MADAMLIVGGYGTVGTVIASQLARHHMDQLIIAGRNEAQAAQRDAELGPSVRRRVLDVARPMDDDRMLADVRCVVMCQDVPQMDFVRQCFQRCIHYVDISA